jgi:hypothetical protein
MGLARSSRCCFLCSAAELLIAAQRWTRGPALLLQPVIHLPCKHREYDDQAHQSNTATEAVGVLREAYTAFQNTVEAKKMGLNIKERDKRYSNFWMGHRRLHVYLTKN